MVMTDHKVIKTPDLPSLMRASLPRRIDQFRTLEEVILEHIQNVLSGVGGNKSKAADILGIDRKTLREKLKSNKKFKDIDK
jgi:DNA-binding NtrC family response regulator